MSTEAQEIFIQSLKNVEIKLNDIGFFHTSTIKKGYATYIHYKMVDNMQILFMYGPSDWHVELSLTKNGRKYEFKDILQIPSISQWIMDNKFQHQTSNSIKDEVTWLVDFVRFVIKTQALT
jgi:hypothetical protein